MVHRDRYVEVPDLNSKVIITNDGVKHGYALATTKRKNENSTAFINAKAALFIPEILANSVEVNQKDSRNVNSHDYTSVMLGLANIEGKLFVVRSVIERNVKGVSKLSECEIMDNLYAFNAKESKSVNTSRDNSLGKSEMLSAYNIVDVLGIVKNIFDDTLSEDVYEHFGMERRSSDFSEGKNGNDKLLFFLKDSESSNDGLVNTLTGKPVSRRTIEVFNILDKGIPYEQIGTYLINTEERKALRESFINTRLNAGSFSYIDDKGNEVYNGVVKRETIRYRNRFTCIGQIFISCKSIVRIL